MNDYSTYRDWELLLLLNEPKPTMDIVFHELFLRHSGSLIGYCRYKVKNQRDAEDIFQETWFAFHKIVKSRQTILNIQAYLIGTARKLIKAYNLKNMQEEQIFVHFDGLELDKIVTPLSFPRTFDEEELVALLKIGLTEIEEIYRETFILRSFNKLSFSEIAEIMDVTIDNVKHRYYRAIRMLKDYFKEYIENVKY
ncbi:MAG: RNA polymerase sigma factor [Ignavibacteriae bacterium]|nr:RNA polymerase sigma factor [Ignavibacteriota bacterium]